LLLMITGGVLRLALGGILTGFVLAFATTRLMSGLLYGVHPLNPFVFCGVAFLLLIAALGAAFIPGRRAARVDPAIALRYD